MRNDIVHYLLSSIAQHAAEIAVDNGDDYEALLRWAQKAAKASELAKLFEGDGTTTPQMKRRIGRFLKLELMLGGDWDYDALYDVYHHNPPDIDNDNWRVVEFNSYYKEMYQREPPDLSHP